MLTSFYLNFDRFIRTNPNLNVAFNEFVDMCMDINKFNNVLNILMTNKYIRTHLNEHGSNNESPLTAAVKANNIQAMKVLIGCGANPVALNAKGESIFSIMDKMPDHISDRLLTEMMITTSNYTQYLMNHPQPDQNMGQPAPRP